MSVWVTIQHWFFKVLSLLPVAMLMYGVSLNLTAPVMVRFLGNTWFDVWLGVPLIAASLLAALAVWCVLAATKAQAKGHIRSVTRQAEKATIAKTESEQTIQQLTQKVATLEAALKQQAATASLMPIPSATSINE
ncbi:MAG: hypothetical protein QE263_05385 [Vampirovibrionales bacterium]|nr:hypothetical protein [Vampirovibrionales bacterium]